MIRNGACSAWKAVMPAVSKTAVEIVAIGTTPLRTSLSSWISLCG